MKKLTLHLDALQVDSFRTVPVPTLPGLAGVEEEATAVCVLTDLTCDPILCHGTY